MTLELDALDVSQAWETVLELVRQGTEHDLEHGPRWRDLSDQELLDHARTHLASVARDLTRVDPDSGVLEAAHVVVRSLMLLQLAIERSGTQD
jgi:hypothetical protein